MFRCGFQQLFRNENFLKKKLLNQAQKTLTLRKMSNITLSEKFQLSVGKLKSLKSDPGNDVKLNLYALYKQATEGVCSGSKPSAFDFVGKAKWQAWNALGPMSQNEAMEKYVTVVEELSNDNIGKQNEETILYVVEDYVTRITLNRPEKKNAITIQMYKDLMSLLQKANENETPVTILTGKGDYFSSGNDLSNFATAAGDGDLDQAAREGARVLKDFVAAFIDFRKVLVVAVNGPTFGILVTLLGLADIVFASEKATFQTPFSLLAQSPEGCSTYMFPKIMGYAKANEMLLFNKKMDAREAKAVGLVSDVFPHATFSQEVEERLSFLPSASAKSLVFSKELCRSRERELLHKVNAAECERLIERWQSPECLDAIMKFFQRKSKL